MEDNQHNQRAVSLQPNRSEVNSLIADFVGVPTKTVATSFVKRGNSDMEFADKVRKCLQVEGLSQIDLAQAIGTNQQQISRWLEPGKMPKVPYLLRIARYLKV